MYKQNLKVTHNQENLDKAFTLLSAATLPHRQTDNPNPNTKKYFPKKKSLYQHIY